MAFSKATLHTAQQRTFTVLVTCVSSRIFLIITIVWFIFQAVYIALSTRYGIPPDEVYHYDFIHLFASNGWLPFIHDQSGYYSLGEVQRTPFFFYHYLLSIPYHLFGSSAHAVIYLRLLNVLMAVGSIYFIIKISNVLKLNKVIRNISIFMLTNTLMFVFLSGSINYDNLTILASLILVYVFLALRQKVTPPLLLAYATIVLIGCLVKSTFLPLALITFVLLLFTYRKRYASTWRNVSNYIKLHKAITLIMALFTVLILTLFLQRYLVNVINYHAITPACDQVNTVEQCRQDFIYNRGEAFRSGYVPPVKTSTFSYVTQWMELMRLRSIGILGHKTTANTLLISAWSQALFVIASVALIRRYTPKDRTMSILILISLFYAVCLMKVNYGSYHGTGIIDMAVQGRYIFPVLPLMLLVINFYIFSWLRSVTVKSAYIATTLLVFVTAGLPSYLLLTDSVWYTGRTLQLNNTLHETLEKAL